MMTVFAQIVLLGALVAAVFFPNVMGLIDQWESDPNFSHGFLVAPIALLILWNRRERIRAAVLNPWPIWFGMLPIMALLALRYGLFEINEKYIETALIPLVLASAVFALGGWNLLKNVWPAIAFLYFMMPLPPSINGWLAEPLQRLATSGSLALLQMIRMPVVAEGNVIVVGSQPLEVARACNGLSMLLSFVTLIAATILLVSRPIWEKVVLALSAIPIALLSNIIRIAATAWCYSRMGVEAGDRIAHAAAGWAMMPIALILVFTELRIMSWLIVEERVIEESPLQRSRRSQSPSASLNQTQTSTETDVS